ncbi:MAG: hypothetical protein O3C40_22645, partial [Planctomycetota bacterium]|nr:hypothetical protein [Planctomycetota bacterium]
MRLEQLENRMLLAFDTPSLNFPGQGFSGAQRPDTVGDVGPNHYVQAAHLIDANDSFQSEFRVYDKSGNLLQGPRIFRSLSSTFPFNAGLGDPIVLYDHLADRWLLAEGLTNTVNVFISKTADPTGDYFAFEVTSPSPGGLHFQKFGVGPDAYYLTVQERDAAGGNFASSAFALDRANMLLGMTPRPFQRFTAPGLAGWPFLQALTPADLDGPAPPVGSPGYFMRQRDDELHDPGSNNPSQDFLELWQFRVDFDTPANSSFTQIADIPVSDFLTPAFGVIAQPGTPQLLTAIPEVIMNRLQYRNFGTHETLVGNFTIDVDGTNHAGPRWFELRKVGTGPWALFQEGTIAPDSAHRWLGAISMDGNGNIALGYNVSSSSVFPSLRYTGRLASDPLGTMPQGETVVVDGTGSQTSDFFFGDYSAMSVDPSDDSTFWFTGEYVLSGGNWATQIASFGFRSSATSGPHLISVNPNDGAIFNFDTSPAVNPGIDNVLDKAPRELTFRFASSSGIDPNTLDGIRITRAGFDGSFDDDGDGVSEVGEFIDIVPGFIGLGDSSSIVIARFAETLPDDLYRMEFFGKDDPNLGITALRDQSLLSYSVTNDTTDDGFTQDTIYFELDLGAQVVSVVPQPVSRARDVSLTGSPTGGEFRLTFNGETTALGAIPITATGQASAALVQTALENLPSLSAGEVVVTGSGPWKIAFQGRYAGEQVSLVGNGTLLTGG